MLWLAKKIWNLLWYPHGKVRYCIWTDEDRFIVSASNGNETVYNCYGSTPESAKEVALFKLQQAINKDKEECKSMSKENGYVLYRVK